MGGGSKNINTITDGDYNEAGANDGQYDTYVWGKNSQNEWFALEFDRAVHVTGVEFTEGIHYGNGGWFETTPEVLVLKDGEWTEVEATCDPEYGGNDSATTFIFMLDKPEWCEGVRISGKPGGEATFVGCTELDILFDDVNQ